MNDNKENYMGIFDNKKQDINPITNNEIKKEETVKQDDLLPMYSNRLEESEKLFDPLGNHPLPSGVEKIEVEDDEKPVVEEVKKVEIKEEKTESALSELDLEKASKSMSVDIIGNKDLDRDSIILFITLLISIILHSILSYNEINEINTIKIILISGIYLLMLISLILAKKKRKSAVIFSTLLIILLMVSIIELNKITAIIGILLLIPTVMYTKTLIKK